MAVPFYLALSLFLALFLSPYDVQIDQRMDLDYFNNSLDWQNENIIFLRILLPVFFPHKIIIKKKLISLPKPSAKNKPRVILKILFLS
jgi:hypothetical protein